MEEPQRNKVTTNEPLRNIIIADDSALAFHLACDGIKSYGGAVARKNPLEHCACTKNDFDAFNPSHPFYGGEPVKLLVRDSSQRRKDEHYKVKCCSGDLPPHSFWQIRPGLYVTSPELTYSRLGNCRTEMQLAEIAMNLCGIYYDPPDEEKLPERTTLLTTPSKLRDYAQAATSVRGHSKATRALRYVLPNTRSPMETKLKLILCSPMRYGGFNLPFFAMNYEVPINNREGLTEQNWYYVDIAAPTLRIGAEYDGNDHSDPEADKRRRNALAALGWQIFVVEKGMLYSADATKKLGYQIAAHMGKRLRMPQRWEERYLGLREELGLPV